MKSVKSAILTSHRNLGLLLLFVLMLLLQACATKIRGLELDKEELEAELRIHQANVGF